VYQQNLAECRLAIIVLSKQQWPALRPHIQIIVEAVNGARRGAYLELSIPQS
jgi:hypothetical protein